MGITIDSKTLPISRRSKAGALSTYGLAELRDDLEKLRVLTEPNPMRELLSTVEVDFFQGKMRFRWKGAAEKYGRDSVWFTTTAASQMAQDVLPPRFWPGLKALVGLPEGGPIASAAWNKFAERHVKERHFLHLAKQEVSVRTGDKRWIPVVRACTSTKYAPYSNLKLVDDLLNNATEFAALPVIDFWITDDEMRIRFAGLDPATDAFAHLDPAALLRQPLPIVEVWNSETGCSAVVMVGGVWRAINNTSFVWSGRKEQAWDHRGNMQRISQSVSATFGSILQTAQDLMNLYTRAVNVQIVSRDDGVSDAEAPGLWMISKLKGFAGTSSDAFIEKALKALKQVVADKETLAEGSLASIVDAVALAAQWGEAKASSKAGAAETVAYGETGAVHQHQIEQVASELLVDALQEVDSDGDIHYAPKKEVISTAERIQSGIGVVNGNDMMPVT